jgi:hypothetical protein
MKKNIDKISARRKTVVNVVFLYYDILKQRVLNDLQWIRLCCFSMLWLLPPSPVNKLDRRHTGRLRERQLAGVGGRGWWRSQKRMRDRQLAEVGGERVGEEPYHMTARKPGHL